MTIDSRGLFYVLWVLGDGDFIYFLVRYVKVSYLDEKYSFWCLN